MSERSTKSDILDFRHTDSFMHTLCVSTNLIAPCSSVNSQYDFDFGV